MSAKPINNIVCVSDLHCGCQVGLCPPSVDLDDGGVYYQNRIQHQTWQWWKEFQRWVTKTTHGEPFTLVVNGDALDGRHHGSVTQISQNLATQRKIAYQVLQPLVQKSAAYYHIRGTEAHVGQSGEQEEMLARELGAIPDQDGRYARWELWIECGKRNRALCHFSHHIGTTGSMHYESTAVLKELSEAYAEAGRWGNRPPDCVVRSHRHRCIVVEVPTEKQRGISATTPGWQGKTPFVYRIPGGRQSMPQCGGILIREAPDGVWFLTSWVRSPKREA